MSDAPDKPVPEPGAFLDPYKDDNPLVTLESLHDQFKADIIRNRLEAAGIPAVVSGETSATALGPISFDAVTVAVRASDVERARRVLAEPIPAMDAEPIPETDFNDPNYLASRALRCTIAGFFVFALFVTPFGIMRYLLIQWPAIPAVTVVGSLPLLVPPFYLFGYSLWLALKTAPRSEEMTPASTIKLYSAIAVDGLVFVVGAILYRPLFLE